MAKPLLTLIQNTGSWRSSAEPATSQSVARSLEVQSSPRFAQLDLFDSPVVPDLRIFIVAMDSVHGKTLKRTIQTTKPRSVIDLRYVARFDQYGSDRETLFACLKSAGCNYILVSMPWHDFSARDFMTERGVQVPLAHHELIELGRGTTMFFVPKSQHADMLAARFNRMLSTKSKLSWIIEQVI